MDPEFIAYWWKNQPVKKKIGYYLSFVSSIYLTIRIVLGA
jgi:hypothetical protein